MSQPPITDITDLSEMLIHEGLVTPEQMEIALNSQKASESLEDILIDKGFVEEETLLKALAKKMDTTFVSLSKYKVDPEIAQKIPYGLSKRYQAIALFEVEGTITVATSKPLNLAGLDQVRETLGAEVDFVFAPSSEVSQAIREYFRSASLTDEGRNADVKVMDNFADPMEGGENLEKAAAGETAVRTVNNIFAQAYEDAASDIHLEPNRNGLAVRLRIDGILDELHTIPKNLHLPVISRIKIIGNMDVAERRVPQDGRVRILVNGKELDLRIATYPTMFGEAAAIRLLAQEQLITMEDLGFLNNDLQIFMNLIKKPHGIFLVTGPTGSGKTTTLYSALQCINSREKHLLSIEDPVEHEIAGVDQQQVNVKAGMTFATALRAMLRQDPDVLMVGEIRDHETADIAVRAAMTGHVVFSTLHTNTAVGAVSRLADLGVEPFLIASTLLGVMAQRLVRKICSNCSAECEVSPEQLQQLGITSGVIEAYKGVGCKSCRGQGYKGRIGLFEIMQVNEEVRVLINKNAPEVRIREKIATLGHHSILEDGVEKVKLGLTTVDEVLRVSSND